MIIGANTCKVHNVNPLCEDCKNPDGKGFSCPTNLLTNYYSMLSEDKVKKDAIGHISGKLSPIYSPGKDFPYVRKAVELTHPDLLNAIDKLLSLI